MGVCSKYCNPCIYRKVFAGSWLPYCDYLCMTGKRRPCPAGDGCTARVTRRVYRKRKLTEEEKAERAERRREQQREAQRRSYQKHRGNPGPAEAVSKRAPGGSERILQGVSEKEEGM